jgi:hypothetical protein
MPTTGRDTFVPSATWAAVTKNALTSENPPTMGLVPLRQALFSRDHLETQGTTLENFKWHQLLTDTLSKDTKKSLKA